MGMETTQKSNEPLRPAGDRPNRTIREITGGTGLASRVRVDRLGASPGQMSGTLFVSDLDGTLLPKGKQLSEGQIATLNRLIEGGLQFTLATARSIQAVKALLQNINLQVPLITLGGSLITRPDRREHLLARTLPKQVSEELLSLLHHRDILPFIAAFDDRQDWGFFSHTTSDAAQWYIDEKRLYGDPRLHWYSHPSQVLGTNILTLTVFVESDGWEELSSHLNQVENAQVSAFPARSFPGWYEVTVSHPQADKGKALAGLRQVCGTKWERVVVFGDDINDLPLFAAANHAVAVENAVQEVLSSADEVIRSNESGSVIDYLAKYVKG